MQTTAWGWTLTLKVLFNSSSELWVDTTVLYLCTYYFCTCFDNPPRVGRVESHQYNPRPCGAIYTIHTLCINSCKCVVISFESSFLIVEGGF